MDRIVCKLELGIFEQFVFLPDGTTTRIKTHDFSKAIVALCHEYENYKVSLIGNKEFVTGMIKKIKQEEKNIYNHNIIEIDYLDGSNWNE